MEAVMPLVGDAFIAGARVRTTNFMPDLNLLDVGLEGTLTGRFAHEGQDYAWVNFDHMPTPIPVVLYTLEVIQPEAAPVLPTKLGDYLEVYLVNLANRAAGARRKAAKHLFVTDTYEHGRADAYEDVLRDLTFAYKDSQRGPSELSASIDSGYKFFPTKEDATAYIDKRLGRATDYSIEYWPYSKIPQFTIHLATVGKREVNARVLRNDGQFA